VVLTGEECKKGEIIRSTINRKSSIPEKVRQTRLLKQANRFFASFIKFKISSSKDFRIYG